MGEIHGGYDFEGYLPRRKPHVKVLGDYIYLLDARLSLSEASELLRVNFSVKEVHILGSLVLARLRHIPRESESIVEFGYRFTVVEATERAQKTARGA